MSAVPSSFSASPGEHAYLSFARAPGGVSYIARQRVGYPFHVGRNLKLQGDPPEMAAVYLQSCSGGLFAGEDLGMRLHAANDALAHVGGGAATVAHGMVEAPARQRVSLEAEQGALLEYLPMATILFPGSRVQSCIDVTLHPGARVVLCDAFLAHAPVGGDGIFDWYRADLDVRDPDGRLLAADRLHIEGSQFERGLPGITDGIGVLGTFMMLGDSVPTLDSLRTALADIDGLYAGVSALPNGCGLFARMAAAKAPELRRGLHAAWAAMRLALTGEAPKPRRK